MTPNPKEMVAAVLTKEERLEKIEKWIQNSMSKELVEDLQYYYQLDKYSLEPMFTNEEIKILDPEHSDIKIETYCPVFENQNWIRFRLSVFNKHKVLLMSKDLPAQKIIKGMKS